ncbi:TetR/AcrR family transcriptional regulator [Actinocrispum wychmicini]|uniref:TetR family transcriptional regulator n=1 Tax=Actinocrispum wychmicini TaxID=1213861 RepID=A0A4R2JUU2_9PSEU|nr:TetR/AcrR family transcriptional regulator [Actinocrispum wychmicini]TCO61046.1 TetR family transcriptional regulator [Actinocrispum wychmicini]
MSPRAGLSQDAVVDLALAVIDEDGMAGLTLAKVADRAGVAPPSLYKHVDGLPALKRLAHIRVLNEMNEVLRTAVLGRSGGEGVSALLDAYRGYLRRYPHRTPALEIPMDVTDGDVVKALQSTAETAFAALREYGFDSDQTVHATRVLRAAAHGFAGLEAAGGFGLPQQLDASFEVLKSMLIHGLSAYARE